MDIFLAKDLINNVALLLSLALLNQLGHDFLKNQAKTLILFDGLILGLITIAIMLNPLTFETGLVFDTRSINLSLSALFFNPFSVFIAAVISSAYRFSMGGVGVNMGIAVIIVVTLFGYLYRRFIFTRLKLNRFLNLYLFGVLTHILMLACMVFLPPDVAARTFNALALDILVIYPIGSLLLGLLLFQQQDQAKLQESIQENEIVYRSIFQNNHAIMFLIEPSDGTIVDVNPATEKFYGYSRETLLSMKIHQFNTMNAADVQAEMDKAQEQKKNYFEFKHRKADGSVADVEVYSGLINRLGRNLLYSIVHDITDKKTAQSALIERDRLLHNILNHSPYAIFVQIDEQFTYLNQTACILFGVNRADDLIGQSMFDRFDENDIPTIQERLRMLLNDYEVPPIEMRIKKINGNFVDVSVISVVYEWDGKKGTMAFARDITHELAQHKAQVEMETRLRQQQKLESIGLLAGGVAHEINNPLNGIMNYAELIKDLNMGEKNNEFANEIIHETTRISFIVKNLLQFSRMEKQSHSYAQMSDIVDRTLSLVTTLLKKDDIELVIKLEANLPDIKCRSQQIQQVILNLITNARDALNEKYPQFHANKRIELGCKLYEKDGRRWFALNVKDFGTGIAPENLPKLFEPFYSTKPKDKGTGLGLSISYGIVKDHHGDIEVDTKFGLYTNFIIHLPVDNGWEHEGA